MITKIQRVNKSTVGGEESGGSTQNGNEETLNYIVYGDSSTTIQDAIAALKGQENIYVGAPFPYGVTALTCRDVRARRVPQDVHKIHLTAYFSDQYEQDTIIGLNVQSISTTDILMFDKNGDVICNSYGDVFDPPPQQEYYDEKITVTYVCDDTQIGSIDAAIQSCRGYLNAGAFSLSYGGIEREYSEGQVKLIDSQTVTAGKNDFHVIWNVTLIFHAKQDPNDWKRKYNDRGFHSWSTDNVSTRKTVTNPDQVWLDENGVLTNSAKNQKEFEVEEVADFSALIPI